MVIIWLMMVNNNDWLVVSTYPSEKWWSEFVSWDDDIPFPKKSQYDGKVNPNSMVPNHQPDYVLESCSSLSWSFHTLQVTPVAGGHPKRTWQSHETRVLGKRRGVLEHLLQKQRFIMVGSWENMGISSATGWFSIATLDYPRVSILTPVQFNMRL